MAIAGHHLGHVLVYHEKFLLLTVSMFSNLSIMFWDVTSCMLIYISLYVYFVLFGCMCGFVLLKIVQFDVNLTVVLMHTEDHYNPIFNFGSDVLTLFTRG